MSEQLGAFGDLIETTLRVVSWNLWWRFGPWEERQPAIGAALERLDPDIACLQEVWVAGGESQAETLADRLGHQHVYASRWDGAKEQFGNAILSRWPIIRTEWRPLPAPAGSEEMRTVVFAEVDGPRGPVQVFCTHLNWRFDESHVRQEQARFIAGF